MSVGGALAFAGSAAIMAALDGAARTLTAAPPALTLCAGAALVLLSMRAIAWRAFALAVIAGACAGLWLPNAAPTSPRGLP